LLRFFKLAGAAAIKARILIGCGLLVAAWLAGYVFALWHHNRSVPAPSRGEVTASFEKSVQWVKAHESAILGDENAFLWWMLGRAAIVSDNRYLKDLFSRRRAIALAGPQPHVYDAIVFRQQSTVVDFRAAHTSGISGYHLLFLYAFTCQKSLISEPAISSQLREGACGNSIIAYLRDPHCATHTSMALLAAQERGCVDDQLSAQLHGHVFDQVRSELTWDPRGGDAFLQHMTILADAPHRGRLKNAWVHAALRSQRPDGGWADANLQVGNLGVSAGLRRGMFAFGVVQSNFHTTVQGLLLMAQLSKDSQP
jgi:hypothetical protein